MARARSEDFKSPPCRIAFAQGLFKARAVTEGGRKTFNCTMIFDEKHRGTLESVVRDVIVEEWGEKGLARAKVGGIRNPILNGDGKEARSKQTGELHPGFGPGLIFIRCSANEDRPPQVRYISPEVPATQEEIYSGCYGFAALAAFAWNHPQNGDGVSFGIRYFQKTRDGENIGGYKPLDVHEWHEQVDEDPDMQNVVKLGDKGKGAGNLFG